MIKEQELSPEQIKAIGTIEKFLRLAGNNPNEHEAARAMAKAQELMQAYNLDQAAVEENSGESGKRADEKLKGGHYEFQRTLWENVAKLNFCLYFSIVDTIRIPRMVLKDPASPARGFKKVYDEKRQRSHRIVGRTVNTRATKVMADYLEAAIERFTMEYLEERYGVEAEKRKYSATANSFREGTVERLEEKIYERRRNLMEEETRKKQAAEEAARARGMGANSSSHAVTLAGYTQSEEDANRELIEPGYIAAKAARAARLAEWRAGEADRQAAAAKKQAEAEATYARWAKANPIEAALQEAQRKKREDEERKREERNARRRTGPRYSYGSEYKGDWSARKAGYERGEGISIDQQADHRKAAGALT